MADKAYHIPHGTEANKTVCGRPIEVNGRPQVLLTTDPNKKKGTVCGRCKALKAGQARTEKVAAKHRKVQKVGDGAAQERKPGKRQPALLALGKRMPMFLETTYKGHVIRAPVNVDGTISVPIGETQQTFNSPSRAGKAVTGREVDGWLFWSYRKPDDTLAKLDTLRKETA
jgi:hypothetical protein